MRAGRWRARVRNGLGLGLLLSCGTPDPASRLDVLVLAGDATFSLTETLEPDNGVSMSCTVDLDSDGAEEVLFTDREGLWWTDGRKRRLLWEGRHALEAQWVPATSAHEGWIALHTGDEDLYLLECASGADPVCTGASHSDTDLDVSAMVVADLDEDEVMDVLTLNREQIALMRGSMADGELEWPSREHFDDAGTMRGLAAADLDGDGHVDVVAVGTRDLDKDEVRVYFGDGAGGWGEMSYEVSADCWVGHLRIVAADDDALPDILIDCTVLRNLGGRQFEAVVLRNDEHVSDNGVILPGHFGGDGDSVLVGTFWRDGAAWSLGTVEGSTWATMPIDVDLDLDHTNVLSAISVDFDGDGIDEVMLNSYEYPGC